VDGIVAKQFRPVEPPKTGENDISGVSKDSEGYQKSKAIPVTGRGGPQVFPVRYEHPLHVISKAIPVTDRGGP
jgi:hypothetical protein